jgi:hypothetical protein
MSENNEASKLAAVLGQESETVEITVADKPGEPAETYTNTVLVRPLRLKQFSEVLKCVDQLSEAGVTIIGNGDGAKGFDTVKLILRGGDAVIRLIAVATGQPVDVIENLDLAESANLAGTIWRVNKNFFEKKADAMLAAFGISPEQAENLKSLLGSLTQSVSSLPAAQSVSPTPEN